MNFVFVYGCSCGKKGKKAYTVQSTLRNTKVFNTKRDSEALEKQINYLNMAKIDVVGYPNIVVENQGERITLLEQWTPQG